MTEEAIVHSRLTVDIEKWPLKAPFRISGHVWEVLEVLVVRMERDGCTGLGEGAGVYYFDDTPESMRRALETQRDAIEAGVTREKLRRMLPPGGARNAVDCAMWDLESKLIRRSAWQIAGLDHPKPLLTTFTCGAEDPEVMVATACAYEGARAIKLKLTGDAIDAERVRVVRAALPNVWLAVDANQGMNPKSLKQLMPILLDADVALIEQPFPRGQESLLDGFDSAIPVAADESAQSLADIEGLVGRFDIVNIKLDKCGGLTEGLAMARAAQTMGIDSMVGNMLGTSLAMAPGFVVGQSCRIVDLDGPMYLREDREDAAQYEDGYINCLSLGWGRP